MTTPSNRLARLDKNFIINGSFHYWQRAITGAASDTFYVDRTRMVFSGGASPSTDQVADVPANGKSKYAMKFTNTQDNQSNTVEVKHLIESIFGAELASEQTSLGFWLKTDHATTVRLILSVANVEDDFSAVTEFHNSTITLTADGVYRFIPFEDIAIPGTAGRGVKVAIQMENFTDLVNPKSFTIAQMKMNVGSKAQVFSYAGRDAVEELSLCQRYYEKSYNNDITPGTATNDGVFRTISTNSGFCRDTCVFNSLKRATPTVTPYSLAGTINKVTFNGVDFTPVIGGIGTKSFTNSPAGGVASVDMYWHWIADAELN